MTLDARLMRRTDLVAAEMDGDTVMLDVATGKYYKLTGPGGDIWNLIENYINVYEVVDELLKKYDVSRDACEIQTLAFLEDLYSRGALIIEE